MGVFKKVMLFALLVTEVVGHAGFVGISKQGGGCQWAYDVPDDQFGVSPASAYSTGMVGAGETIRSMDGVDCVDNGVSMNCANTSEQFKRDAAIERINNRAKSAGKDKCMNGSPTDSPFYNWGSVSSDGSFETTWDGQVAQWELPIEWRWSVDPVRPFFCPGETVEWRHYVAADHNGYHRLELLDDPSLKDLGLQQTEDGEGYVIDAWSQITTDSKSVYYKRDGSGNLEEIPADQAGLCDNGEKWTPDFGNNCRGQIWMMRRVEIPSTIPFGTNQVIRWTWLPATDVGSNGDLLHCYNNNGNACAEVAYFGNCLPIIIGSPEQCSSTPTPPPSPSPSPTPVTTSVTTSAPVPQPTDAPTPPPAPTPTQEPGQCVAEWGQCGGKDYTGPTTCCDGLTCVEQSEWYSQCGKPTPAFYV